MDWVDRPQNYKDLYGILHLLQGSHLDNFPLKTLKLGWVAFHSLTFQLRYLDFQSNQYKKLAPVLSRFCNGPCRMQNKTLGDWVFKMSSVLKILWAVTKISEHKVIVRV